MAVYGCFTVAAAIEFIGYIFNGIYAPQEYQGPRHPEMPPGHRLGISPPKLPIFLKRHLTYLATLGAGRGAGRGAA